MKKIDIPYRATDLLVVLFFLILSALWCSKFFSFNDLGSNVILDGDGALNAWALNWVSLALTHDWTNLFNGNTFYPHPNSIALSEHMVGLAVFNIPVRLLTDNPWVGYNLLIFTAYFVSAIGGYYLISYLTKSKLAGFWAGLFWGFCFFRIHHIGHLQILSYQWFPLVALFQIKTRHDPTIKNGLLLSLFFLLQALTSWYLAVIVSGLSLILFIGYLAASRWTLKHTLIFSLSGIIVFIAILPFALPYVHALKDTSLTDRLISTNLVGDQVKFLDFFTPPVATVAGSLVPGNKYWIWQENTLYIGYIPCLLALVGLLFGWKNNKRLVLVSVSLILFGYTLAMGYRASQWGLHLPLYYLSQVIPFIAAIRATQRFALLLYFGIFLLSGLGIQYISSKLNRKSAVVLCLTISGMFLFEVYPYQLPWVDLPHYSVSPIDVAINTKQKTNQKKYVVLHYPIYTAKPGYPTGESKYMVDSTLHWANILNGFSGAEPKGFHNEMITLDTLPSVEAMDLLRKYKVDILALHKELDEPKRDKIKDFFTNLSSATIDEVGEGEYMITLKTDQ